MSKYQFTNKMAEISGFGGEYEAVCRRMISRGLEWFDAHPDADPHFTEYKDVFGIINEDNEDAEALSAHISGASNEITGAMHQQAVQHILWIRKKGWDKYVDVKTRQKQEEDGQLTPQ